LVSALSLLHGSHLGAVNFFQNFIELFLYPFIRAHFGRGLEHQLERAIVVLFGIFDVPGLKAR